MNNIFGIRNIKALYVNNHKTDYTFKKKSCSSETKEKIMKCVCM